MIHKFVRFKFDCDVSPCYSTIFQHNNFCVSVFPQGQSYLIIFKQWNLTFVFVVRLTFTIWWSRFITVPSVKFDMLKSSIRLVNPQVCNNQIWLWCHPLIFCHFSAQHFFPWNHHFRSQYSPSNVSPCYVTILWW